MYYVKKLVTCRWAIMNSFNVNLITSLILVYEFEQLILKVTWLFDSAIRAVNWLLLKYRNFRSDFHEINMTKSTDQVN